MNDKKLDVNDIMPFNNFCNMCMALNNKLGADTKHRNE